MVHILILLPFLVLVACGGRGQLTPQSPLDTTSTHYQRGLQAFADGDLWTAQAQFERVLALDKDDARGWVGSALVSSRQGSFFRARQQIEQAVHRDGDFADAHVALGRIVVEEGLAKDRATQDWLEEAQRAFAEAKRLSPDSPEADFHLAAAFTAAGQLAPAVSAYQRVIALNSGPLVQTAMRQAERLQTIQRASPGTRLGVRIAMQEQLNRAELAVLLLEEMRLAELVAQRQILRAPSFQPPGQAAADAPAAKQDLPISVAWARPWIEQAASLGVAGLEPLPDGSYAAQETVTRADLARVVGGILTLLSAGDLSTTQYVGQTSRFADVQADHFTYGAIALSVDRGIMRPDPVSGLFRPNDPVPGSDALLIIRQLQNAVRMEF